MITEPERRKTGRREGEKRERSEDATLLALKMKEEAVSQGMQGAPGSWKRQRNGPSQEPPVGTQPR